MYITCFSYNGNNKLGSLFMLSLSDFLYNLLKKTENFTDLINTNLSVRSQINKSKPVTYNLTRI
jgi:hypothetical protein